MILAHKIALDPTPEQEVYFAKACGTARFAYNWALQEWKLQFEAGEKPTEFKLRRQLNNIKREHFPWMLEVTKVAVQSAIRNLGKAFDRFFKECARVKAARTKGIKTKHNPAFSYPAFKKKGKRDSFRAENGIDSFEVLGKRIKLPKVGWVKMREALRFDGKPRSVVVSRVANRWFASIIVDFEHEIPIRENQAVVGVDLGIKTLATTSQGPDFPGPKALKTCMRKLRRHGRSASRKTLRSANRKKANMRLAKLHARIANIRADGLHKLTTYLTRSFQTIGIEDLNVKGMLANRRLARAISDVGMSEFRRQLSYKAEMYGSEVVVAPRFFPSSKTCSACGVVVNELSLSVREWTCKDCGTAHDRDKNAAINLERYARDSSARCDACGALGSGARRESFVKPPAMKQEPNHGTLVHG